MMSAPSDPVAEARRLARIGDIDAALAVLAPLTARLDIAAPALSAHAAVLKQAGRRDEALPFARRAVQANPTGIVAHHNLASLLGDLGMNAEAETSARHALLLGGDAPETWLVLGRALQGQSRFDEAEAAYRQALTRRALYVDALTDLSQLIWMRTADLGRALVPIEAVMDQAPAPTILKARLIEYAGNPRAAYDALITTDLDPAGHLMASRLAIQFEAALALRHAEAVTPSTTGLTIARHRAVAEAHLAIGHPGMAQSSIQALRGADRHDQHALALEAQAARMLNAPRHATLHDYAALVRPAVIDTPDGWPDLNAYLTDLSRSLEALHGLKTHPVGQSLRHGSQTTADLTRSDDPAIRAFFTAIDEPIRAYLAAIGQGQDPLRSRNTGDYRISGCWSARLGPNGFHANHIHSQGWLSSACYINLPAAVSGPGQEGWIKFGEPPVQPPIRLDAQHAVQPSPGLLVLFPSYMWHGTVPFTGQDHRLTVAFDVVPA